MVSIHQNHRQRTAFEYPLHAQFDPWKSSTDLQLLDIVSCKRIFDNICKEVDFFEQVLTEWTMEFLANFQGADCLR